MSNKLEDALFLAITLLIAFTIGASIFLGAILQESYRLQPLTDAELIAERGK